MRGAVGRPHVSPLAALAVHPQYDGGCLLTRLATNITSVGVYLTFSQLGCVNFATIHFGNLHILNLSQVF